MPEDQNHRRRPRIIVIGPNKCGTTSLHKFFEMNGLKSIHYDGGRLAKRIISNISSNAMPLAGYDEYECFSDICYLSDEIYISSICLRDALVRCYPNEIYILNTRRFEGWLESRNSHGIAKNNSVNERLAAIFSSDYDAEREYKSYYNIHSCSIKNLHIFDLDADNKFVDLAHYLNTMGYDLDRIAEVKVNATPPKSHIRRKRIKNKMRHLLRRGWVK